MYIFSLGTRTKAYWRGGGVTSGRGGEGAVGLDQEEWGRETQLSTSVASAKEYNGIGIGIVGAWLEFVMDGRDGKCYDRGRGIFPAACLID